MYKSFRTIPLSLAIAVMAFVVGVTVRYASAAWQSPPGNPPTGGTAPLNVGGTSQTKSGTLQVATDPASVFMVGDAVPTTKVGVDADNKKYGIDVKNAQEFAGYFRGDLRVVDPTFPGGYPSDAHDDTVGIYSNASQSGLYVEQQNRASAAGLTVSSSGEMGIQTYGSNRGIWAEGQEYGVYGTAPRYGVYGQAGYNFSQPTYGVYGKAASTLNPQEVSIGLFGDTGDNRTGDGKVYGLYVQNSAGRGDRWAGFFEDTTTTNQPTVEINSLSAQYGLRVINTQQNGIAAISAEAPSVIPFAPETYGVIGRAGNSPGGEHNSSYGVYGYADGTGQVGVAGKEVSSGGGIGVLAIAENGTSLVAENKSNGYAAKFKGLVDAGSEGFFLDGTAFLGNYVFAATKTGALAVGTNQITEKLTVDGSGDFKNELSSTKISLTDQLGGNPATRYPLSVEYKGLSVPRLCVETPAAGGTQCQEVQRTCESKAYASFRTLGSGECANLCNTLDPRDYICRWSCNGKIGYDDCVLFGDGNVQGAEQCATRDGYIFDNDTFAPASNCTCIFAGPGVLYDQAEFVGSYDKRCIDFSTNIVP